MRVRHAVLDDILLALLCLVMVLFALVGAHTLLGWIGPAGLILGGAYYGWRETRNG